MTANMSISVVWVYKKKNTDLPTQFFPHVTVSTPIYLFGLILGLVINILTSSTITSYVWYKTIN